MISSDPLKYNRESVILDLFSRQKYEDIIKPDIKNTPNCFKTVIEVPSIQNNIPSQYTRFNFVVPKSGLLKNMYLRTTLTSATNPNTLVDRLGLLLYDPIILRNGTETIFKYHPSYLMAKYKNDGNSDGNYSSPYVYHTPIPWNLNIPLLLDFHKNLELEVSYTSIITPLTFTTVLIVELDTYEREIYNSIITDMYLNDTTNILGYKNYCQEVVLVTGATSTRFLLERGFFLCSEVFIQILKSSMAKGEIISKIELETNNKVVLSTIDKNRNVCFNYRFDEDNGVGGLSLKTGNYYLTVYHDTLPSGCTLYLDIVYHSIFISDNSTGLLHSRLLY